MSIKKQFLKSKPVCKVKFTLPKEIASGANQAFLVGDFNDWDTESTEMKKLKNGTFTTTIELGKDQEHQFRYLVGDSRWVNDIDADHFVPANIGHEENGVLSL